MSHVAALTAIDMGNHQQSAISNQQSAISNQSSAISHVSRGHSAGHSRCPRRAAAAAWPRRSRSVANQAACCPRSQTRSGRRRCRV
eukprot:6089140-Prymnesium_polylepis.3